MSTIRTRLLTRESLAALFRDVRNEAVAGALLFAAGTVALLGIITAEVLYPGYSTLMEISDLGATRPPNSVIVQPSATIFNTTMLLTGALVLVAVPFVYRAYGRRGLTAVLALFGAGVFGVGVFDGSEAPWHGLFALLTFVSGGVSALVASRAADAPFRYLSAVLGAVALTVLASALLLGESNPLMVLGLGGVERWVVYPVLMWVVGFGGYLMGRSERPRPAT
ncbi:DUF998 domain-containing protein [Halobium salinum]|uniref:DUF998 domain-containing protein n=1 Tax=Halobium salinum TaxID=1364940 RepID=A0ABD5PCT0_9EURY|nr:DUF998 domain-containing protein [Halobium salinum]